MQSRSSKSRILRINFLWMSLIYPKLSSMISKLLWDCFNLPNLILCNFQGNILYLEFFVEHFQFFQNHLHKIDKLVFKSQYVSNFAKFYKNSKLGFDNFFKPALLWLKVYSHVHPAKLNQISAPFDIPSRSYDNRKIQPPKSKFKAPKYILIVIILFIVC